MSAKLVIKAINEYSRFMIASHIDLEGDALGSELALASLLRKLGKKAFIANASRTPSNYNFLPGVKKIYHRAKNFKLQAAFIIDCSNKGRIGKAANLIAEDTPVINIDHHTGNDNFGQINWVDTQASSAGEMIYHLFKLTKTLLDKKDALNIYTAILTDTGSFRHSNTSSTVLRIVSRLIKFGISPAKIYAQVYENNSAQDLSCAARIISKISFAANNRIAWVKINKNNFKKIRGKSEILGKILDFAHSVNTVKVVLIFGQLNNRFVKLSLRSKSPINVQKIAHSFGGGGHKRASGCTIKGSLKQVEQKVLRQVKEVLRDTKKWTVF